MIRKYKGHLSDHIGIAIDEDLLWYWHFAFRLMQHYTTILLDLLLLKISTTADEETAVLAIPETCVDSIIALYHSSLFAEHQGVIKTYLTISNTFFIPNLIHYFGSYIKGCHIC